MKMGEGIFVFNFSVKNIFHFRTFVSVFDHSDCRSHLIVSFPCTIAFLLLFICSDTAIKLKQKTMKHLHVKFRNQSFRLMEVIQLAVSH